MIYVELWTTGCSTIPSGCPNVRPALPHRPALSPNHKHLSIADSPIAPQSDELLPYPANFLFWQREEQNTVIVLIRKDSRVREIVNNHRELRLAADPQRFPR